MRIQTWCDRNHMKPNWAKTHFMIFRNPHSKRIPEIGSIKFCDSEITEVKEFKCLGVWLNHNLTNETHCQKLMHKLSGRMYFLSRMKRFIPKHKLNDVLRAIIMSSAQYGIEIWGYESPHLRKVQHVLDSFVAKWHHCQALDVASILEKFSLMKLHEYSALYLAKFARLFLDNFIKERFVPEALHDFLHIRQASRDLRSNHANFEVPMHRTRFYENSVKYRLIKFWNSLPQNVKISKNKYDLEQFLVKSRF